MFCIYCGKKLIDRARFCTFCGGKVMECKDNSTVSVLTEEQSMTDLMREVSANFSISQGKSPAECYVLGLKKEAEGLNKEAYELFSVAAEGGHTGAKAKLQKQSLVVAAMGAIAGAGNIEVNGISGTVATGNGVTNVATTVLNSAETARVADISARFANGLENLNTGRGGQYGLKGFVGEEMQAAQASFDGKMTYVINNNGDADLVYIGKNGHKYYQQLKIGKSFKPGKINFEQYKGQTLVIDKGNPHFKQLKAEGAKHGVKVVEGSITKEEAETLAKLMKKETALRGTKTATIVPKVYSAHKAGLQSAKSGALYGGGFSLGSNLVDVVSGDKELGEAACDVAKDTAVAYGTGYVAGAVGSAIASTSTGAAVIGAASSVGSAVASTTVGGAVIGGATAATAAIGAAGTAATTAAVGAVGLAGTAVGAAAVAAAPVVAVGAVLGAGYKFIKNIFD